MEEPGADVERHLVGEVAGGVEGVVTDVSCSGVRQPGRQVVVERGLDDLRYRNRGHVSRLSARNDSLVVW